MLMSEVSYKKSLFVNFIAYLASSCSALLYFNICDSNAFVLFLIVLILCNEAWYRVLSIPAILIAIWESLTRRKSKKRIEQNINRYTSFSLLIIPHFIYALLYVANRLTDGLVASQLSLNLSSDLFLCSYGALVLVWVCANSFVVYPLSLSVLFAYMFNPEITQCKSTLTNDDNHVITSSQAAPHTFSIKKPKHPAIKGDSDKLLYCDKPVLGVTNAYIKRMNMVGALIVPVSLLFLLFSFQSYATSVVASIVCLFLGILAAAIAYSCCCIKVKWDKRLKNVEYAITSNAVYIIERKHVRKVNISSDMNLRHEIVQGNIGNVYITEAPKMPAIMQKVNVEVVDLKNSFDFSAPLQGLFQINNSEDIYRLLVSLREASRKAS